MERYTASLCLDVAAPRLANLRSKYSTAPPKVPRNPSRESAVLYSGLRRNSCNKIRKWILQLLDEKYRRRLHRAAYYLDTPPLRSSWNSVRFTTRNANHLPSNWHTARWTCEINAGNSSVDRQRSVDILPSPTSPSPSPEERYCEPPDWKIRFVRSDTTDTRSIGIQNLRFPDDNNFRSVCRTVNLN